MAPTVELVGGSGFCKGSDILLTADANSGISQLSYQWQLNGSDISTGSSHTATQAGTYTVEVTDTFGCSAITPASGIVEFLLPSVTISGSGVFCSADTVAWTANATPGSGAITTYQWKRDGQPVGTNSPTYTPSQAGNYEVQVTDINGCTVLETKRLLEIPTPVVLITGNDMICTGDTVALTANAAAGGGAVISSYQWRLNGINIGANSFYLFGNIGWKLYCRSS